MNCPTCGFDGNMDAHRIDACFSRLKGDRNTLREELRTTKLQNSELTATLLKAERLLDLLDLDHRADTQDWSDIMGHISRLRRPNDSGKPDLSVGSDWGYLLRAAKAAHDTYLVKESLPHDYVDAMRVLWKALMSFEDEPNVSNVSPDDPCRHTSSTRYVGCGGRWFDLCDDCEAITDKSTPTEREALENLRDAIEEDENESNG